MGWKVAVQPVFWQIALDAAGAQAFRDYKQALEALQSRIAAEPAASWKISPGILEANINA